MTKTVRHIIYNYKLAILSSVTLSSVAFFDEIRKRSEK